MATANPNANAHPKPNNNANPCPGWQGRRAFCYLLFSGFATGTYTRVLYNTRVACYCMHTLHVRVRSQNTSAQCRIGLHQMCTGK